MKEWARRGIIALIIWAMIIGLLRASGFAPHFLLIAAAVVAATAAFWLVADVGSIVRTAGWGVESNAPPEGRGGDLRAERLQRDVTQLLGTELPDRVIVPLLIDLIEDRVANDYGVDASTDPAAFAGIVGPELAAFTRGTTTTTNSTSAAGGRRHSMSARSLAGIIARIEAL